MEENRVELPEEEREALPETLFCVTTVLNAETQKEASETVRGKAFDYISWFFMGLCALLAGILLWQYFFAEPRDNGRLLMALIAVVALLFAVYNKLFAGKKALKRWEESLQKQFGTTALHLNLECFPLSLSQTVAESGETLVEGYSSLSRMKESEHLFLLQCGKQQWFFVSKEGFTKGNAEDFRKFISEKIGV